MAEHGSDSAALTASILAGSDMVYDLFCEVCADFDKHLEAKGFCIDCFEYLCCDCVKVHGTHRLSRNHVVQTKSKMPRQKPQQKQSKDMDSISQKKELVPTPTPDDMANKDDHAAAKPKQATHFKVSVDLDQSRIRQKHQKLNQPVMITTPTVKKGEVRRKKNIYPDLTPRRYCEYADQHPMPPSLDEGWEEYIPTKEGVAKIDIDKFCKSIANAPKDKSLKTNPQAWDISEGNCEYHTTKPAKKEFPCKHKYCVGCFSNSKDGCKKCIAANGGKKPQPKPTVVEIGTGQDCVICLDACSEPATLPCSHQFCKGCMQSMAAVKPLCPICTMPFGVVMGTQPDGRMWVRKSPARLPGYEKFGRLEIMYLFEDGTQKECHPNPGRPYKGIQRKGYLPDNPDGQRVLRLFKTAFSRRLIFTIGESRTTGQSGLITWNDIHHKTLHGDKYSYPDPSYLGRVQEELAAKGVTE